MGAGALALVRANVRYWPTVAPLTARELRRWERRAGAIADPSLRGLALSKLAEEHFNAQVATTLATLAPRRARTATVRALVALEVAYDYLDGLTERPAPEALARALELFASFTGAFDLRSGAARGVPVQLRDAPDAGDGGYADALAQAVRAELAGLSSWPAVAVRARSAALRTAQAQARLHCAPVIGEGQLREWAGPLADAEGLGWREFLAGAAASVLACHALIVAASDPATTALDAQRLDGFYLRLCALSTLLDALVDRERDVRAGAGSLLRFYEDEGELSCALVGLARQARVLACGLPDGGHHLMVLVGVVAYYTSAPAARGRFAGSATRGCWRELSPLIFPTLVVMWAWRSGKALRSLMSGVGSALWWRRWRGRRRRR